MKLGYIPNKTVNDTNTNKIKNSLLLTSLIFSSKNLLNEPPKAILLIQVLNFLVIYVDYQ